jgi:hypothetical protein
VLGWQLGSEVVQVGPTTLLARGATLRLSAPIGGAVRSQVAATGMVPISNALLDQQVVQTDFSPAVTVIGVLVENPSGLPLGPDAVVVGVDRASVSGDPMRIEAGRRTLFLYDVTLGDAPTDRISVTAGLIQVADLDPHFLAGVLGAPGSAADWAAALNGSTLTQLVGAEQLTVDGSIQVRLTHE